MSLTSLLHYLFPEVISPDCPYGGYYNMRNDSLMMFNGFIASVVCFAYLFVALKRKQMWPEYTAKTTSRDIADRCSTVTNPVLIRNTCIVSRARIDNRRLERLVASVVNKSASGVNKSNKYRSNRRGAKRSQHRLPRDDQDECLVAERMTREGRYDDIMAEKDALKYTLMETEQHCLGLMMEAQLRYVECMDVQDELKQVAIRTRLLEDTLAFMRNK